MMKRILIVAAVLVLGATAPAAAQYPEIIVTPGQVVTGGEISVEGSGCPPNSPYTITLKPAGSDEGVVVAEGTADADGAFNTSFIVPAGTEPGSYDVVVQCGDIIRVETIQILANNVTPPTTPGTTPGTTPSTPPGTGSGDLPTTGSDLNGYGLVGAGLLTVGGLFLLGARKRRTSAA